VSARKRVEKEERRGGGEEEVVNCSRVIRQGVRSPGRNCGQ